MMSQVLRDYQLEMLERLHQAWSGIANSRQQSVMVQMPTGTGKTYLMAEVIRSEECRVKSEECQRTAGTSAPVVITEPQNDGIEVKPAEPQQRPEPQQLDLFAFEQLKAENERLQEQIERMKAGQEREAAAKPQPTEQAQPVMQPEGNQRRALRKQRKHTVI